MNEFLIKRVKNGFIVTDVDLNEDFIFTRQHQVMKFLKERFAQEVQ
tara:strand:+ start:622 stop:759 length:138 start_codon:yes stop_codon:yes gene_type:complete